MDQQLEFLKAIDSLGGITKYIPLAEIQKIYPDCPEYRIIKLTVNSDYFNDSGMGVDSEFMITPAGREYIRMRESEKRSSAVALITLTVSIIAAVAAVLQFFL